MVLKYLDIQTSFKNNQEYQMGHSMVLGATFVNVTVRPTIANVTF